MADRYDHFDRNERKEASRQRLFEGLSEDSRASERWDEDGYTQRRQRDLGNDRWQRDDRRGRETEGTFDPEGRFGGAGNFGGAGSVTICSPKSYKDVQGMIEKLARKESVIVNFENVESASAQRVLDFLSGASYALGGSMKRIKEFTFLITPQGTGIMDQDDGYSDR